MYNKVVLVGNLTRDLEIRYTSGGTAVASTGIAVTKKFKSTTGEQKEDVLFIDITFFGRTAEVANQYLKKGSKVLVDGRLKLDQWTANDGSRRSKHTVTVENLQMLGSREGGGGDQSGGSAYPQTPQPQTHGGEYGQTQTPQPQPQTAPQEPKPKASGSPQNPPLPEIDINEDEIPF